MRITNNLFIFILISLLTGCGMSLDKRKEVYTFERQQASDWQNDQDRAFIRHDSATKTGALAAIAGIVKRADNTTQNKVRALTGSDYFTVGDSVAKVLSSQGTPQKIEKFFDEKWLHYGDKPGDATRVVIKDGKVDSYDNANGKLRVHIPTEADGTEV
jgi:hypothetical protein